MSAIQPPPNRLWWKQPLDRTEGAWIGIAFVWCLVMFFMMPCSFSSTSSRVQERRMLFCDISRPEVATPPALAALPGP